MSDSIARRGERSGATADSDVAPATSAVGVFEDRFFSLHTALAAMATHVAFA